MRNIQRLRQSAEIALHHLARDAGLQPEEYRCAAEWVKDDANRLHIVQRFDADGKKPVVLKLALKPEDPEAFGHILDAMHQAESALAAHPTAKVPRILAENRQSQSYLMEYFPGETFLDRCRASDDHTVYLRQVGGWLSAYHAGTFTQERPFQPRFMVRHMAHLVDQMSRGERKIRGQKRFIELASTLADHAQCAEGFKGKIAAKHGDLNAHNLLIGDGEVAALDFLAQSNAPVAYDIARLLLSYIQMVGNIEDVQPGEVLPAAALGAFFEGYQFIEPTDPTVQFLLRVQILTDWNRMQDKSHLTSIVRFERIKEIARRAFA